MSSGKTYTLISFRQNYEVYLGRGDYEKHDAEFIMQSGLNKDDIIARVVDLRTNFPDHMSEWDRQECKEYWFEDVEHLSPEEIAMEDKIESMVKEHNAEKEKACFAAKKAKKEEADRAALISAQSKNESDRALLRELAARFPDEVEAVASTCKPAHSPGDGQA